jgi:hypothetical protein
MEIQEQDFINMKFQETDLLTSNEVIKIFNAQSPIDVSTVISRKLKKYIFIDRFDDCYRYNHTNVTYKSVPKDKKKNMFLTVISQFLNDSYKAMSEATIQNWCDKFESESKFKKFISDHLSNKQILEYYPQLSTQLVSNSIMMDNYTWQLHFQNGYINLKDGRFYGRVFGRHFVSFCINRKYTKSTQADRDIIMGHVKKVYVDEADRMCMISQLAKCLKGTPQDDQDSLWFIGLGSSGKSTMMNLCQLALGGYVQQYDSKMFVEGNAKRDKIFSDFISKRYVLFAWVNEMSGKRICNDDLKNFCDGLLKVTKLYIDGCYDVELRCKLIGTMNNMPKFQIDTGVARRLVCYEHKSQFLNIEEDKPKELKFKMNRSLLRDLKNKGNLLNAWIDILVEQCVLHAQNKSPKLTANFTDMTSAVIGANDYFQDFIDSNLEITKNDNDRIGKDEMCALFKAKYPEKHITPVDVMSALRDKHIEYSHKKRVKNVATQGCYIGVKIRTDLNHNHNNTSDLDYIPIEDDDELEIVRSQNKELETKIKQLEAEMEKLKKQNLPYVPDLNPVLKTKPKPKEKPEPVFDLVEVAASKNTKKIIVTDGTKNTINSIKSISAAMMLDYD